jgi:hypothetical protein
MNQGWCVEMDKDTVQDFWDMSNMLKRHEFEKRWFLENALVQKNSGKQVFFTVLTFFANLQKR